MSGPLDGQSALVTGASRGIGRAVACLLGRLGARVFVNFRSDRESADETVRCIAADGGRAESVAFDVANADEVGHGVDAVVEAAGRLDVLVNNAGMTIDNVVVRLKPEQWERVMAVNLQGTFHCTRAAARPMMRARYGRIINLGSVSGQAGNASQSAYAAAKAGIIGFTKSMARELASRSITVNVVAPGLIDTEMTGQLPDDRRAAYLAAIPVGRFGSVDEVADAVGFLARREAGYVTGQVIGVNGGLYM